MLLRWAGAKVGKNVRINSSAVFSGNGGLIVGDDVWIGAGDVISPIAPARIAIGSHIDFGPGVMIVTGSHEIDLEGEHIGGKDVLIFCPQHIELPGRGGSRNHNGYLLGHMDWDKLIFTPDGKFHMLDFGFDSYAAACANNIEEEDKAFLIAWMGLPDVSYPTDEEDWAGCLTLPRELTVRGRRLIQRPLPELKKLRDEKLELSMNEVGCYELPYACEVELDIRPGNCELDLFTDKDGNGGVSISYDDINKSICIDRGGMKTVFNESEGMSRIRELENPLSHLRIFVDKSSVEIFVNDGDAVFTSRVFPTKDEHFMRIKTGDAFTRVWTLKPAVKEHFLI